MSSPPRRTPARTAARALASACLALAATLMPLDTLAAQASARLPQVPELPPGVCAPDWSALVSGEPGLGDGDTAADVRCAVVWDDGLGDGPVLFAAGHIWSAHGEPVRNIARWDGTSWSDVGGGVDAVVNALAVMDDGGGEQLYVGGQFDEAGGVVVSNLARWDGAAWSDVEGGVDGFVWALDALAGSPVLMVGGDFTTVGGSVPANRAAIWSPGFWGAFGDGFDDRVLDYAVYDGEIYAGGRFSASGATPLAAIARWTGSLWEDVDGGVDGIPAGVVETLEPVEGGPLDGLWVGGAFNTAGFAATSAFRVARWQGGTWFDEGLPVGNATSVYDLLAWDDGGGLDMYAAGAFVDPGPGFDNAYVARHDGSTWTVFGGGLDDFGRTLVVHDDGSGPSLWVGGRFERAGDRGATGIARWDGTAWQATGVGLNDPVIALLGSSLFGGVPTLYMGGYFTVPGQVGESFITSWSGGTWHSLGGANGLVRALAEYGGAIYAAGEFTSIGGVAANRIAKWDGSSWSPLGTGLNQRAFSLHVFDEGGGPQLYTAGDFSSAGGVTTSRLAKWDGAGWSVVGNGGVINGSAYDLAFYDDGGGEHLYVSGYFTTVDGIPAASIARWDGSTWSPLSSGLPGSVFPAQARALAVFDGGGGEQLYVGGNFQSAGGVSSTKGVARWDGSSWSSLSGFVNGSVNALLPYADGNGCRLIVAGSFNFTGPVHSDRVSAWDGNAWSAMGTGVNNYNGAAESLAVWDQGAGPELVVGGSFTTTYDAPASYIVTWGGCWNGVSAWVDLGFGLQGSGFGPPLLIGTGSLALGSSNQLNLLFANPFAPAGLFLSFTSTPVPFAGGTLVPFPFFDPVIVNVDPVGQILLDYDVPVCLPSGVTLYAQWVIQDGGAIAGYAMSNAVVGTTP